MKSRIMLIIICALAICLCSCAQVSDPGKDSATTKETESQSTKVEESIQDKEEASESVTESAENDTKETDSQEVSETVTNETNTYGPPETSAMEFVTLYMDYDDYIIYVKEGKLDEKKYDAHNAKYFFPSDEILYFDVKEALKLCEGFEYPDDCDISEYVVFSADGTSEYLYTYNYSVKDSSNKVINRFSMTVKAIDGWTSERLEMLNRFSEIKQLSEIKDQKGTFMYKNDNFWVAYEKNNDGYQSINLFGENICLQIRFYPDTLTPEEIKGVCGDFVYSLLNEDSTSLDKSLEELAELSKKASEK